MSAYQVALELLVSTKEEKGMQKVISLGNKVVPSDYHVVKASKLVGEYVDDYHIYYLAGNKEHAEKFAQKANETGLIKKFYIDELM